MPHQKRQKPVKLSPLGTEPDPVLESERNRVRPQLQRDPFEGTIGAEASRPLRPSFANARTLAELELGRPGGRDSTLAPAEIFPNAPGDPTRAGGIDLPPARPPFHSEARLRQDRSNFAFRQRADTRRRQRLGLPPRQLNPLPPLRTFARIRDAAQISDAQIPGGVPTLDAPTAQINLDNLQDNQVYRTVDNRFVRFNAEDGSFTQMVFNPRGGTNQEGAFEIDPDVDDPAAEDIDELINTRLIGLTSEKALASLDPVLAKNIRQRGRAVQAVLDSDLSPQQKLETVKPMLAAIEKLFPEESPEEGPLPIHEAIEKSVEVTDDFIFTQKADGSVDVKERKPDSTKRPVTDLPSFVAQNNANRESVVDPRIDDHKNAIADSVAAFVAGGLEVRKKGFREKTKAANVDAYITTNLSRVDEVAQELAQTLLSQYIADGGIGAPTNLQTGRDSSPEDHIFTRIGILAFTPEMNELARSRALVGAGAYFDQVIKPGLLETNEPMPDKTVDVVGKQTKTIEIDGTFYPIPNSAADVENFPPRTRFWDPIDKVLRIAPPVPTDKPNAK